ncbi:MAG: hypothetical protein WC997_09620 [Porticoccaceae bacterium]
MKILSKYPGAAFAILLALSPGAFADIDHVHRDYSMAQMMASALISAEGIPCLYYAFEQIESDHGSVLAYLEKELDVGPQDTARLRAVSGVIATAF